MPKLPVQPEINEQAEEETATVTGPEEVPPKEVSSEEIPIEEGSPEEIPTEEVPLEELVWIVRF